MAVADREEGNESHKKPVSEGLHCSVWSSHTWPVESKTMLPAIQPAAVLLGTNLHIPLPQIFEQRVPKHPPFFLSISLCPTLSLILIQTIDLDH